MSAVAVVWLVDADPPSEIGGGKGFYPASAHADPPDETLMRRRFDAIRDVVIGEAGGKAVLTVHTSPRYRTHFYREPYLSIWHNLVMQGCELALHPHEDRADGSSLYDDGVHLANVVGKCVDLARSAKLPLTVFRSGGFSFHPDIPRLLDTAAIGVDLSAAPGLTNVSRCIEWPAASQETDFFTRQDSRGQTLGRAPTKRPRLADKTLRRSKEPGACSDADATKHALVEVPLGWDRKGADLDRNYLFNERMDRDGLMRVFDCIRRTADSQAAPAVVNFLTHGFGLEDRRWRDQAIWFLRHAQEARARLVTAAEAATIARRAMTAPQPDMPAPHP